jgi:hypothetical protein
MYKRRIHRNVDTITYINRNSIEKHVSPTRTNVFQQEILNMTDIFSKVEPGLLLHKIHKFSEFKDGRTDIIDGSNFLQLSTLRHDSGKTFVPHQHIYKPGESQVIAQESWVVLQGRVKCSFYDIDGSFIGDYILEEKDFSVTLRGGHNYEFLEDDSYVLEFKTGPYKGQSQDKVFISNNEKN